MPIPPHPARDEALDRTSRPQLCNNESKYILKMARRSHEGSNGVKSTRIEVSTLKRNKGKEEEKEEDKDRCGGKKRMKDSYIHLQSSIRSDIVVTVRRRRL